MNINDELERLRLEIIDRDYALLCAVTNLKSLGRQIEQMKRTSLAAIENATKLSTEQLKIAKRLKAESSPEALESERAANAILTEENAELENRISALNRKIVRHGSISEQAIRALELAMKTTHRPEMQGRIARVIEIMRGEL